MTGEPASSICYAAEADDVYMGFASRAEIIAALNELLEAERAGARATLRSGADTADDATIALLKVFHADEVHWCAMLAREIKRLGQTPSRRCSASYSEMMAIGDPVERLGLLNCGQAQIVRELAALLPRVRDDPLHAELQAMLVSHEANMDRAERS